MCLCLLAGIRIGAMVIGPHPPVPEVITVSVGRVVEPPPPRDRSAPPVRLEDPVTHVVRHPYDYQGRWIVGDVRLD